jgi:hypothetical protein
MTDIVVPIGRWKEWLAMGDHAGQPWSGREHALMLRALPDIEPGERVYIAHGGIVRGYAPLIRIEQGFYEGSLRTYLIRGGGARAMSPMCSMPSRCFCQDGGTWLAPHARRFGKMGGFQYRSWDYLDEWLLGDWKTIGGR